MADLTETKLDYKAMNNYMPVNQKIMMRWTNSQKKEITQTNSRRNRTFEQLYNK